MQIERKPYEFVGGSLDGQIVQIGGGPYIGIEWPGESLPGRKREIYILLDDHKFHFARYGLKPNIRAHSYEAMEELRPIKEKLAAVFEEMGAVLEKHGGPSNGSITAGNWTIKHKDA